jgi:site-specific DNA recombinase
MISRELFEEANKERVEAGSQTWGGAHINQHFYRSSYLLTGMVRCSKCSYAFQGFRHKKSGRSYYVDGGRKNKGEAVCGWYSIPQQDLENFVIEGVKKVLLEPQMLDAIERELRLLLDDEPNSLRQRLDMVRLRLNDNEQRRKSLLESLESGHVSTTIVDRLKELESVQRGIQEEEKQLLDEINKKSVEKDGKRLKGVEVAELVRSFFTNFPERFNQAPLMEKKELLRMVVEKIEVDPETHTATTQYRRVPAGIFEQEGISTCDGQKDRLHSVALTGIEPVFQP